MFELTEKALTALLSFTGSSASMIDDSGQGKCISSAMHD